ncbi:ubiquinone biosynthesis protein [Sporobacter termitidis DSM 10068]|uniref:Ubiquinone biosynthesis protein n=1 Tax=Sporobacter termitidis DSM 10068 TaxID=1123282 RepID=A0A1M5WWA5_9FIRM|nr:ubiquinone biosynthesis protein [Sporobacter termitidis DSM 10068]
MTKGRKCEDPKQKDGSSGERLREILGVFGRYNLIHGLSPEKLRHILEDLGPTFIKLGQILSMRPDMIPEEYCRELTRLRTEVRPMAFAEVVAVLESEYGDDYREIFSALEEKPLGSASIAQVHAAVLKNGRSVVVKVQRPDIYDRMCLDIRLLHKAAVIIKIIGRTGQVIDLNGVLDEMWAVAKQEMDFMTEAEHIRRFGELNRALKYVAFPEVEWELTTPKVLCMERIEGIQIDDTEALLQEGYDLHDIAQKLAAGYAKQVIEDGFFHADPHPGNILIRDGKIVFIDLGMVGTLSAHDRQLLKKSMMAIVQCDVYELKQAVLGISRHTGKINHSRLSADIDDMLNKYGAIDLGGLDIGQAFMDLMAIAETNGLSMPAGISMLGRGMITMEGVIGKVDPETDVISVYAAAVAGASFEEFDLRKILEKNGRLLYGLGGRSLEFSSNLMEIMKLASKGQSKLNIELVGSEEPLSKISHMVNRLIISLLSAAILIGSSLICLTDMKPTLLGIPLFGVLGYTLSFILGAWLVFDIIIKKKL